MPKPKPFSGKKGASRFASIDEAIEHFRRGGISVLVDDESRENEGDFCIAAEKVSPETINFMTKEGRGLVCLALTTERVEALGLPMMVPRSQNGSRFTTAFTVSIEARKGVTTGISAQDRAHTIATAIDPEAGAVGSGDAGPRFSAPRPAGGGAPPGGTHRGGGGIWPASRDWTPRG